MKRFSKIFAFMLMAAMTLGIMAQAQGLAAIGDAEDPLNEFIPYIEGFYGEDHEEYANFSEDGTDITEVVYRDTQDIAAQGDWEQVYRYFQENVTSTERTRVEYRRTRAMDIAKSQQKDFAIYNLRGLSGPDYKNCKCDAYFTLSGTIYYNPNTKVVSSVGGASMYNKRCNPTYCQLGGASYSTSKSTYSGTITAKATPTWNVEAAGVPVGTVIYQQASGTMTIQAE